MARDYSWSRNSIPARMNTIGELARLLGLGRHQTRRRLVASGLPFRVYVRRWQDPNSGKWYSRRAIGIPQKTAGELVKLDMTNSLGVGWKSFSRAIKSKSTEPPPLIKELIRSIQLIQTDRPEFPLVQPRPIRLKTLDPKILSGTVALHQKTVTEGTMEVLPTHSYWITENPVQSRSI